MCDYCDDTKKYLTRRKAEINTTMATINKKTDLDIYTLLMRLLIEVEAIESVLYGGLMFVPEGDK
jgi:hypothetical protein